MDTQVLDLLLDKYKERIALLQDAIAMGGCKTFDEYQRLCGLIQGLEHAQNLISDLAKRMENDDE